MSDSPTSKYLASAQKIIHMADGNERMGAIRDLVLDLAVNANELDVAERMLLVELARVQKFATEQKKRLFTAWPNDGKSNPPKCEMCSRLLGNDRWKQTYDPSTQTTVYSHCCKDTINDHV